jgi:formate hydrogenlyase transcriptional activator
MTDIENHTECGFKDIIGESKALHRVLDDIETVAPADSTVLIYGETGTGKELIARSVHNLSSRKANAFVRLNCAAIPTGLLESELFGHEKGAFTGAIAQRAGRFELAHRGTIFLDEIGEIPLELQPKLLRVLQEREFERLGSARTLRSDARLIAATNCDLKTMVDDRKFRSDLYYRLNVFPIRVPPLRERAEDIPVLVQHFVQQFSERNNRIIDTILSETMEALTRYHWPGNIRELQNVIERAVIITKGATLTVSVDELKPDARLKSSQSCESLQEILSETERIQILRALESSNWVISGANGAAARLGIKRTTLQARMQKLGIRLSRTPVSENRALPSIADRSDRRVLECPVRNPAQVGVEREGWQPAFAWTQCNSQGRRTRRLRPTSWAGR